MARRLVLLMLSRVHSQMGGAGAAARCTGADGGGGRLVIQASGITGRDNNDVGAEMIGTWVLSQNGKRQSLRRRS